MADLQDRVRAAFAEADAREEQILALLPGEPDAAVVQAITDVITRSAMRDALIELAKEIEAIRRQVGMP
jgi:hypothetical protein